MSREIKFRGLDKRGVWRYGSLINNIAVQAVSGDPVCQIIEPDQDYDCLSDVEDNGDVVTVIAETVGQYTGLKDKNGVEIYEGDVLRLAPEYTGAFETPQIVVFEDGRFLYQSTTYHGHKNDISQSLCANHVVIGNIYSNPEPIQP